MSVDNFIKLNISDYTTRETYDTVRSVTGTQKVHSIVTVPVTVHSKTYRLDLRLLDASCCCCCLPTPMTLASGGSPMFPHVVHQPASPSIWPAVQSLRRGLSTNPGVTMWCVCGCS